MNKPKQGLWHGVAAAALWVGHRLGVRRGLPFDVEGLEDVAAVIAFELLHTSYHSSNCFKVWLCSAKIVFLLIMSKGKEGGNTSFP